MRTVLASLLLCAGLTACPSRFALDGSAKALDVSPVTFEEISLKSAVMDLSDPLVLVHRESNATKIAELHPVVGEESLAAVAHRFDVRNPKPYSKGIIGKVRGTLFFGASRDRVPDFDKLYWVMVQVLSERYGCFIKQKQDFGSSVKFICRDKRTIVFWRTLEEHIAFFYGKQFDKSGRELIIENHRIIATRPEDHFTD